MKAFKDRLNSQTLNPLARFLIPALAVLSACGRAPDSAPLSGAMSTLDAQGLELSLFIADDSRTADPTGTDWTRLLDQSGGSQVHFGVVLVAPEFYERNATTSFVPASNAKLFTSIAALDLLGPDFRFETRLEWISRDPGHPEIATHVNLIGSGDPSWGLRGTGESATDRINRIAQAFKQAGVRSIEGSIEAQSFDPRLDEVPEYPQGIEEKDRLSCYGALAQGFNAAENCANFRVSPKGSGWTDPAVTVPVRMATVNGKGAQTNVWASVDPDTAGGYVIHGTIGTRGSETISLPVTQARDWVRGMFARALESNGITLLDGPGNPPRPNGRRSRTRLARVESHALTFQSPPLNEILRAMNKDSVNFVADSLFKALGARHGKKTGDLPTASAEVMSRYLASKGLDPAENKLVDGSGLSHLSATTPASLMALLRSVLNTPVSFKALWESLPIAGVDGTLKNRMKDTAAEGYLRAKTGTLKEHYNLAGFVPVGKKHVPFVILTQAKASSRFAARAAEDRVGAALSALARKQKLPTDEGKSRAPLP